MEKMEKLNLFQKHLTALYLEITSKCNLNCLYCYNESSPTNHTVLPLETVHRFLTSSDEENYISTIILSGGEPFLHPEIESYCKMVSDLGYSLRIYTNGTLLSRETIRMLTKYRPSLQITLDSANAEVNDFYKGNGTFRKIVHTLDLLSKEYFMENVTVRCNLTYEVLNSDTAIDQYIQLLKSLGVKVAYFSLINNQGRAKTCTYPLKSEDMERLQSIRQRVVEFSQQKEFLLEAPIVGVCQSCPYATIDKYHGGYLLHISPDGSVYPCSALAYSKYTLGNIHYSNFSDICLGLPLLNFIESVQKRFRSNPLCDNCIYRNFCGKGCIGELNSVENLESLDTQCVYRKKEIARIIREKLGK